MLNLTDVRGKVVSLKDAIQNRVTALYETHRDAIYRFLVGQGLRPAVAQEIAQDVFIDIFVALHKGAQVESEQGWLYTVAGRAAVDYWRHERGPMWIELDSAPEVGASIRSTDATPEAQAGRRERLARVAADLQKLPKEQRMCIHLRMQGLRYREIARILGVSTSTAADWLACAVKRLRGATHD